MLAAVPHVGGRSSERGLLVRADDAAAFFGALRGDATLARFVRRWLLLDGGRAHATLHAAAASLAAQLPRAADEPTAVRLHALPRCLEAPLGALLTAAGARPTPQHGRAAVVACVAAVHGVYFCALASAETLRLHVDLAAAAAPAKGVAVSRAYYKMREVCARFGGALPLGGDCIDVGAAPGGWTACLAAAGCRSVVAVDPARSRCRPRCRPAARSSTSRCASRRRCPRSPRAAPPSTSTSAT